MKWVRFSKYAAGDFGIRRELFGNRQGHQCAQPPQQMYNGRPDGEFPRK